MDIAYKLDSTNEAKRLEEQSANKNYSLKKELEGANVVVDQNDRVLDAGCGTGLLSRFLIDYFNDKDFDIDAIDITESLIQFAKAESSTCAAYQKRISFQQLSMLELEETEKYDKIFSRFVFQHIPSPELRRKCAQKLWDSLRAGGQIVLIDCYGFFSHMDTSNLWLKEQIELIERSIPIDMNVGIKLRGLFLDIGVPVESIQVTSLPFSLETASERQDEADLWRQRFENAFSLLASTLGELGAKRFALEYVKEVMNPRTYIFAQKIITTIKK